MKMKGDAMKNVYISCPKHLKPMLKAQVEVKFQNLYIVKDNIEESDLVYVVGDVTISMERELIQANRSGIPIIYANEKFQNDEVYDALLSNKKTLKVKTKEKAHNLER